MYAVHYGVLAMAALQKRRLVLVALILLSASVSFWNLQNINMSETMSGYDDQSSSLDGLWSSPEYSARSKPGLLRKDNKRPELVSDTKDGESEESGYNLAFNYKPPPKADVDKIGKTFEIPDKAAKETAILTKYFIELNTESAARFVFATAASENHFNESRDGVASAQANFPGKSIYYYDLGLTKHQAEQIKRWKYVVYRKFDFSKYPEHFHSNLRMCGWKPFVIRDVLKKTGGVMWMDASARVHSDDFRSVFGQVSENGGLLMFKTTGHSNYAATHGDTYEFLPTRLSKQRKVNMNCAAAMLVYNTREMFYNVLWWWFLCAYDRRCLAPMEKNKCSFSASRRMETYANCHKYDQSTINILLSNYHGYNLSRYTLADYGLVTIERWPTSYFATQIT